MELKRFQGFPYFLNISSKKIGLRKQNLIEKTFLVKIIMPSMPI